MTILILQENKAANIQLIFNKIPPYFTGIKIILLKIENWGKVFIFAN